MTSSSATDSPALPTPGPVLAMMCVIIAVNQIGFGALLPVLPLYAQSFGVSASAIGMSIAVYGLARVVLAMPGGRMADRFGRRPTLALGGLLSALGNLWCALADSFPEFMLARFVAGAGAGVVLTIGAVVLADISKPAQRGRMMAIYQSTFLFAVGIGPLPGGLLAEAFGLAIPFAFYAGAAAIVALLAWLMIPETREFARAAAEHAAQPSVSFAAQVRQLLERASFVLVCLVGFTHAVVRTGGLFIVVPLIAATSLGLSAAQIGTGFATGSILGLIAAYPAGAVADRYGRKAVIVPSTLLTAVAMASYCVAPSYLWFVLACIVWGIASSVSGAAPAAYAADVAPPGTNAAAMSSYRTFSDIGYVIGPIGLGWLMDVLGARPTLALAAVVIGGVGLLFAWRAPETFQAR